MQLLPHYDTNVTAFVPKTPRCLELLFAPRDVDFIRCGIHMGFVMYTIRLFLNLN